MEDVKGFGKLRSFLWPIHSSEYKKFIPTFLIFFLTSFNYNLLRSIKDSFVVTAHESGAEALPFIKLWGILPMALFMTFIFTRLSNKFSKEKVFYIMMGIFLGFFALFAFILYPARDFLHPNELADTLQEIFPTGFHGFIAIFRNWTSTLFYVMSELWGVIILTVLFWGFTNNITSVKEAKRFYSLFGIGANFSGIISGFSVIKLSNSLFNPSLPFGKTAWDQSVLYLNAIVILVGLLILCIFRWLNKNIVQQEKSKNKKPKVKMSMRKNFAYLMKSKYLICIALIVLMYNIAINLVEILWKNQLKELCPNPGDYASYMGQIVIWAGILSTFIGVFISGNAIRRLSWTASALITTMIVFFTGIGFFSFLLFKGSILTPVAVFFHSTPLLLTVLFGSLQNCFSRACKYTLFDATKELAFVPLEEESKMKGKAAIDGVGSRLGKSGGAVICQMLLLLFGSLAASTPYIAVIFLVVIIIWSGSVISLGKQFQALITKEETIHIEEPSSADLATKAQEHPAASS